jgi:hypothetical protein
MDRACVVRFPPPCTTDREDTAMPDQTRRPGAHRDAPTQLHQKEATTPGSIADLIVTALYSEGGRVLVRNADDAWATGFVVVKMLDGTDVRVNIELD